MTDLACPALLGSHPLGALASFGLLRLVAATDPTARLRFELADDWIAVLVSEHFATRDALIAHMVEWCRSEALDRALGWAKDVRVPPQRYRELLSAALARGDDDLVSFLCAFAADGATDRQDGKRLIKPTAFYMASANQSFLLGAAKILSACRSKPQEAFHETLVGPWAYRTLLHSLGWDPATERMHALRDRAPNAEKPRCIAGAVLLGLWALPLFPPVAEDGSEVTTGFDRHGRERHFSWPLFTTPITIDELRSLLQTRQWYAASSDAPQRRGIAAVYRSRRSEFGQGYAVFRTAQLEPATRRRFT